MTAAPETKMVRIDSALHYQAKIFAAQQGKDLKAITEQALLIHMAQSTEKPETEKKAA